jgi:hypothetical protein
MEAGAPDPKIYRDIPGWVSYDERQKLEISNDLGIMDKNELAVFLAIAEYSDKYKTAYIPLQEFYKYLYEYGLRTNTNALKVEDNIVSLLRKVYYYLHKKNYCRSDTKDNKISALILYDPQTLKPEEVQNLINKLKVEYTQIKKDSEKPFLTGDFIPKTGLSSKVLTVVSIRELSQPKISELVKGPPIVKILFPSNNDIILLSEDLPFLSDIAFDKLRKYLLRNRDMAMLLLTKLKQQFQSLATVNRMDVIIKSNVVDPNLWAAMATEIINMSMTNEKNSTIFEASEIIKFMSIIKSDEEQKKTHSDKSLEVLLKIMETYAVLFGRKQLLALREKHAYLRLHTERDYIDLITDFIAKYSVSESIYEPPRIIGIKEGGEQKYIYRSHILPHFFEKLDSIAYELKKQLSDRMDSEKEAFLRDPLIRNPDLFDKYISEIFHKKDPMIVQLVENPNLLYSLMKFYGKNDPGIALRIDRFFYSPTRDDEVPHMKSLDEVLLISWEKILKDVRNRMPFIYRIPILGFILKLLSGFGKYMDKAVENQLYEKKNQPKLSQLLPARKAKKQKKEEVQKAAPNQELNKEKQNAKLIKERMLSLQQKLIGDRNIDEMIAYYESKWNHKINQDARQENINIIKTKVQHRLGFIKQVTADIIKRETNDMMRTELSFQKVTDTESLKMYITLYMIRYYLSK